MKHDMDELLKRVLTPEEEPGEELNRNILKQIKEEEYMKKRKYKCASVVAAAALAAASSLTAYAAWQYRSAAEVAEKLGDDSLSQILEQGDPGNGAEAASRSSQESQPFETGVSQSYGGYKAVLLGMVSGKDLSEFSRIHNGSIRSDRTYLAVAISREDGAPVEDTAEEFFVSPLVGSLNPGLNNTAGWCGSYGQYVEDGILYRLVECDNIEYFADRKLYVCVTDTAFYDSRLYDWDEAAGSITRNEKYQGLNALFELQVDPSKADPEKAQAFLDEMDALRDEPGEDLYAELPQETKEAMAWADKITPQNIEQYCVRLENTVQTKAPDEEGRVAFEWLANEEVSDTRGGGVEIDVDWYFKGKAGTYIEGRGTSEGMNDLIIEVLTLNEDGTVTFSAWVPKEGSDYLK